MANVYSVRQTSDNAGAQIAAANAGANAGHRDVARNGLTKALAAFNIDFAVNGTNFASTELGAAGAVKDVLNTIATLATVVGYSAIRADAEANAGQVITVLVEGDFGTDTYDRTQFSAGTAESFAAHLEDLIQAKTSVGTGSVNLSSATVTAITGFPLAAV
jgi:hypothetical protein